MNFFQAKNHILPVSSVREVDLSKFDETGKIFVFAHVGYCFELEGIAAIDALMRIFPSALEGRRLRWVRHRWVLHNLVAHPALQLLSWAGLTGLGMKVHDWTVPRPRERQ